MFYHIVYLFTSIPIFSLILFQDIMLTANALKSNLIQLYNIPDQMFTHTDFLWAKDADILVYQKLGKDLLSNL